MKRYLIFIFSIVFVILTLSSCFLIQKPALEAPILLMPPNGTVTSTSLTLSWKVPNYSQPLEYKVFFGTNSNPQYVTTVQSTSFTENDLAYSTKYYWQIVAFDQSGQSATSAVWSFTTEGIPRPSTPILRVTDVSTNSVTLGWTQSEFASAISIYQLTSTVFSKIKVLAGNISSYTVGNLKPSTVYRYFVVATNASGNATSGTVTATTLSFLVVNLVSPVNNSTLSGTGVTLKWNSNHTGVTYKVFFGTNSNPSYLTTTTSTSLTENNLSYSTTYYWKVSGIFNNQSATSAVWSFTTGSAPLPTVTNWATMGPYNIPNSFKNISVDAGNLAAGKVNAFAVDLQNPQIMYRGGGVGPGNSGPDSESGLYKSIDGGNHWFQIDNGLTDPMIDSIWIDQSNPDILLVGTWLTGIFRSSDGGNSWSLVYNSQTANFYESGNSLYAATAQGVLLSQDNGQTWTLVEPTSNPVRVITGGNGVLYAGLDNGTIMAQYENSSWQTVYTPSQSSWHTVWSIAVDPYSTQTVYAVEWQGYNYPDLIFTTNGGKDWNNSTMNYAPIQYVTFDVNTEGVIYAGADGSLYRSDDNGNTWNEITQTGDTRLLYSWPGKPGTIVAGTDQGLYISYNSGQSWTDLNGGVTSSLLTSFAMSGSSIFTAVQDFSPIVTFNGGQNWNQLYGTNPPIGENGTFKINPGNPNYVYAFTTYGFQYSQDGGNTFYLAQGLPSNPLTFSGNNNLIAVNPSNPSVVYVATKNGVYESTNWGVSWQVESSWPSNPSLVFVSPNGTIYVGSNTGLFVSNNGGSTWTQSNLAGASGYPVSIDVDPANNQIVLLGMSTGPDQGGGLLKSTDGGYNFTQSNSGINMASNWEWDAVQGLAMWSVKFDPQDPAIVALGTAGGIFMSYNYGNTWISIKNNAIPNLYTDLAWSGNYLYTSSYGEGILRLMVNIP